MAKISDFKAQLSSGGARTNQFRVDITYPSYVTTGIVAGQQGQFLCKAAQLPASDITNMEMFYRGRPVNFAGERTFQPSQSITKHHSISVMRLSNGPTVFRI